MSRAYRLLFDKVLTRTDPEAAHHAAFRAMRAATPLTRHWPTTGAALRAMGIDFPARLGLAAGFDKNGEGIDALAAMGFGFVEIGTVTARPQPGNPRPRLARLPRDRAVVNRMGFNNAGADAVAASLARGRRSTVPLGINIGKTKVVPEDDLAAVLDDHRHSTRALATHADYLVVNVSSPNTPGLRSLQSVEKLEPILRTVRETADQSVDRRVPLLVKIAPDLADDDVLAVADMAVAMGLDGIVATNTTIARGGLASTPAEVEAAGGGGLSGPVLASRAVQVTRLLRDRVGPDLTIIGVGGITTAADARARLEAGADLLQAYTAFIYEGPLWPRRINAALAAGEGNA